MLVESAAAVGLISSVVVNADANAALQLMLKVTLELF